MVRTRGEGRWRRLCQRWNESCNLSYVTSAPLVLIPSLGNIFVSNIIKELTSLSLGHCTLWDRFKALALDGTSPSDCSRWRFPSGPKGINRSRSRFTSTCCFGIQWMKEQCCQSALMFKLLHEANLINSLQHSDHRIIFFCSWKNAHRHFWCTQTFLMCTDICILLKYTDKIMCLTLQIKLRNKYDAHAPVTCLHHSCLTNLKINYISKNPFDKIQLLRWHIA